MISFTIKRNVSYLLTILLLGFISKGPGFAGAPIADAHIHYNWNQAETLSADDAIQILKAHSVVLAVVSSTPPELALELKNAGGAWVIPLYSPYLTPPHRRTWYTNQDTVRRTRTALAQGQYKGIGEVHIIPGLGPRRDNPVLQQLIGLSEQFTVPFLLHTDASNYRFLLPICQQHSEAQFIWAHAGGILPAQQVGNLLEECPNVAVDLSARDSERYVVTPIIDKHGRLLPDWEQVVMSYSDRFMIGSDALWPVMELHNWYEADQGWQRISRYYGFHRRWLSFLPIDIQQKIRLDNAFRIYGASMAGNR